MRKFILSCFFIVALTCVCGCGEYNRRAAANADDKEFKAMFDRVVTSAGADEASKAIRQASDSGKISFAQKRYLEAMVVYKGFMRFDSVVSMCSELVDLPEVKSDVMLSYRIYALMTNAAASAGNYGGMVQYATQTIELARKLGKIDKEQEMVGTVGYGMILLGRGEDGLQMIDDALRVLSPHKEWNCRNSYMILSKLKIAGFDQLNRPGDMLAVCDDINNRLNLMEKHPEEVKDMPEGWSHDHKAFAAAIDLYRSQTYAYMAYAYAKTGQRKKALKSLADFDKTDYSSSVDAQKGIVLALGELNLYSRMLAAYRMIDRQSGGDTLNDSYREELQQKASAASSMGNFAEARLYLRRYIALSDTLDKMRDRSQMAQTLSLYRVHEEQMKANDAAASAKNLLILVVALLVVVVLTVAFAVWTYRQNKETKKKNKILVRTIESAYSYRDKYEDALVKMRENFDETAKNDASTTDSSPKPVAETNNDSAPDRNDERLFAFIDKAMREKKMYLDADFQRQTLVDVLHIDRNRIGRVIKDWSGFPNLSAYVNSFRLEHAYLLLRRTDRRMTVDRVSRESGFTTVRTFQRLFKDKYGMTPAEFRESYLSTID